VHILCVQGHAENAWMEFVVRCKHGGVVHFSLSRLAMEVAFNLQTLKEVAAHQALLRHCPGCKREDAIALAAHD
jgi:hypothetical protein